MKSVVKLVVKLVLWNLLLLIVLEYQQLVLFVKLVFVVAFLVVLSVVIFVAVVVVVAMALLIAAEFAAFPPFLSFFFCPNEIRCEVEVKVNRL